MVEENFPIYGNINTYNTRSYVLFCPYCMAKVGHELRFTKSFEEPETNLNSVIVGMDCSSCGNSSIWIITYEKNGKKFSAFTTDSQKELINKNSKLIRNMISFEFTEDNTYYPIKNECCIYPSEITNVEQPVKCMPDNIKSIYEEAASIVDKSPRAAATLLRLALQSLLEKIIHDKKLKSIYDAINNQLDPNTPDFIKDIMNIVRKEGNNSAHKADYKELGYINIKDNNSKAMKDANLLFHYINIICKYVIGLQESMYQFKNDLKN